MAALGHHSDHRLFACLFVSLRIEPAIVTIVHCHVRYHVSKLIFLTRNIQQ